MAKQVRETTEGRAISAWIILDKEGNEVATINAHYSKGGMVRVDVFNNRRLSYQGRAGGYGYDKFTAAIAGAMVGDVRVTDHCGDKLPLPEGAKVFPPNFQAPEGYSLTNYSEKLGGWTDCYRKSGLDGLRHKYRVIQVI